MIDVVRTMSTEQAKAGQEGMLWNYDFVNEIWIWWKVVNYVFNWPVFFTSQDANVWQFVANCGYKNAALIL